MRHAIIGCSGAVLSLFMATGLHAQTHSMRLQRLPFVPGERIADIQGNKINAYVDAANALMAHPQGDFMVDLWPESLAAAWRDIPDASFAQLKAAMAMPGRIPIVDYPAEDLAAAMETLLPLLHQQKDHPLAAAMPGGESAPAPNSFKGQLITALQGAQKAQAALNKAISDFQGQNLLAEWNARKPGSFAYIWLQEGVRMNSFTAGEEDAGDWLQGANNELDGYQHIAAWHKLGLPAPCSRITDLAHDAMLAARNVASSNDTNAMQRAEQLYAAINAVTTARNLCNTGKP